MPDILLRVNGREYGGWKKARVVRGIRSIAGSFSLTVSDRWAAEASAWPILPEDECEISIAAPPPFRAGSPLLTGYVDRRGHKFATESEDLSIEGRDVNGALVDCSALLPDVEYYNVGVLEFVKKVVQPFGIEVTLQPGIKDAAVSFAPSSGDDAPSAGTSGRSSAAAIGNPNAKSSLNPGESCFELIDRACRQVGLLPVSDGLGGLLLTRAGTSRAVTALVQGVNIKAAEGTYDATKRYARYIVLAQQQGTQFLTPADAADVQGEARDATVRRANRVLVVHAEDPMDAGFARRRAEWEAKVRASRSAEVTITVQGWTQSDGTIWPINALVPVKTPRFGIDADMLIVEAAYVIDPEEGTSTELTVVPKDAYIPEPVIATAAPWETLR